MNALNKIYRKVIRVAGAAENFCMRLHLLFLGQIKMHKKAVVERGVDVQYGFGNHRDTILEIGAGTRIKKGAVVAPRTGFIRLGCNCSVNPFCVLLGYGGILIGDNVRIAAGTSIIAFNHNFEDVGRPIVQQGNRWKGIQIGDDVWIGTGVRILDGVRIGRGAVIGAGSVVTKDIPDYTVAVGVPARVLKHRGPSDTTKRG